jgi:hypothetical protein
MNDNDQDGEPLYNIDYGTLMKGLTSIPNVHPININVGLPPNEILEKAFNQLESCTVIGTHKDGTFWFDTTHRMKPDTLWDLQTAIQRILNEVKYD